MKTKLEEMIERQDKFGRSCDPGYTGIKEQNRERNEHEEVKEEW